MNTILVYIYETCCISEVSIMAWMSNTEEEWQILSIAEDKKPVKSLEGWVLLPDLTLDEFVNSELIKGLIFPGGFEIHVNEKLAEIINLLDSEKKLLGAICAGPTHLALAGILHKYKYTTSRSIEYYTELKEIDPFPRENYQEVRSIRDNHVITSKGEALLDFTDKILDFLHIYNKEINQKEFRAQFTPTWE